MRVVVAALTFCAFIIAPAQAGDPTGYWHREIAAGRAPNAEWWNSLASGKGLCCDFADGKKVEDVDWSVQNEGQSCERFPSDEQNLEPGHFCVRLNGKWWLVPDKAVITDPNRYGPAVVWPIEVHTPDKDSIIGIRCFMPGAQS